MAQLTRNLAFEWGGAGVRVNPLAPTCIATPMIERLAAEGKVDPARLERRTPMGRIGQVDDVARAAAFLLCDWSSYITGVVLPVDGGVVGLRRPRRRRHSLAATAHPPPAPGVRLSSGGGEWLKTP